MKYLTLLITLFYFHYGYSQNRNDYFIKIDTIETFDNRILGTLSFYENEQIVEISKVYLYPVIRNVPRYRVFRKLFIKQIEMDSIVILEIVEKHFENGDYFINSKTVSGTQTVNYFNKTGKEISPIEFEKMKVQAISIICGRPDGQYLITGTKKNK